MALFQKMNPRLSLLLALALVLTWSGTPLQAQTKGGQFSGDLEWFQNVFFLDSSVLSDPIPPQYYQQLSSTDASAKATWRRAFVLTCSSILGCGTRTLFAISRE
ncbi:MAG: hypothetical protein EBR22_02750 [Cytophagia bacterium]|nr:hypothetical protein [Cytophagia bacterium]